MALQELDPISYGEHEIGRLEKDVNYRIRELKKKIVNKEVTKEEKEELILLTA